MDRSGGAGGHAVFGDPLGEWHHSGDSADGGGRGWADVSGELGWSGVGGGGGFEGGETDFSDGEWFFADEGEGASSVIGRGSDGVVEKEKGRDQWGDGF